MTRTNTSRRALPARSGSAFLAATRPLGRAALSCGLAGALSIGAAGAALAGGQDGAAHGGSDHGRASGQKASAEKSSAVAASTSDNRQAAAADKKGGARQAGAATTKTDSRHPARSHQQKTSGSSTSSSGRGYDPRGNNGTIKVDGPAWDARVDNEPHTSCAFRVTFFGFDEGQTADITVTGIAPTGGGVLLHETAVPTSDDPAGGAAHDFDGATRVFTADDLGLDAVTPHPQQGYHLKVAVDSLQAPGGAKQKVLWLEPCGTQAPVTQPETGGVDEGGQTPAAPTSGEQPQTDEGRPGAVVPESAADSELPRFSPQTAPPALRAEEAAYREVPAAAGAQAPARTFAMSGQQASALPTSLAFTGAAGLELLALTGAAAAAAGAGLLVARRRAGARAS